MSLPAVVPPDNLLGNYRIVSRLGTGGMGTVYKAYDLKLHRDVALKFLFSEQAFRPEDRERVLREARAASALDHENIAAIHAVEETPDGQLFIVMGFYQGENLALRMARAPLSQAQVIDVVRQVTKGLAYAHAHNVIHRDIKPSNVILCDDGIAKIVDFGLARVVSEDATRSLGIGGTLPYMSPEQVSGKMADARSDIWALGVLLYELLTRRQPFSGDNPAATVSAILHATPPDMGGVPPQLQLVVYQALSKQPKNRFQSCTELLRDLDDLENRESFAARTVSDHELDRWLRLAGESQPKRFGAIAKWIVVLLIVLFNLTVFGPLRSRLWRGANPQGNSAMKAPHVAYQSYEKAMGLLKNYYRPGAISSATGELENAIRADPTFALAYAGLGEAYYDRYRIEQNPEFLPIAESNSSKAIELNDQLADVYVTLGRVHDGRGNQTLALAEVQRALELDPNNSEAFLALADIYSKLDRAKDAEQAYDKAIALNPDGWDGYYRRAVFFLGQQRYEDAINQFRRVLEIVPDHAYARTNMAVGLKELNRVQEAEAELKKALEYNKVYSIYGNLANLYFEQRRFSEAAEMGAKALELNQTNYMLWINQGVYYEWLGQLEKADEAYGHALTQLEKLVQVKPKDATIHADLALQYAKKKLNNKALSHLRTALALQPRDPNAPKDPRVLAIVGDVYSNLGDRAQALTYTRESIKHGRTMQDLGLDPDLRELLSDAKVRHDLEQLAMRQSANASGNQQH